MTLSELATILTSTGYPVRYGMFKEPPATSPYIEYECSYTENFGADNKAYHKIQNVSIFLFTKTKDPTAEEALEMKLDGANIYWNKTESFLQEESVFQILYEVKINE